MLDLQARVHLEEVELAVGSHQALDRAGGVVVDRRRGLHGHRAEALAQLGIDDGRRTLFDDFLMPPLQRAFALADVNDVAVLIAEDLDFDVARRGDELLGVDRAVAEERLRFAGDALVRRTQILLALDEAHPLAAAARAGLDHDREAGVARERRDLVERLHRLGQTGHDRHAGRLHPLPALGLRSHRVDRLRRRADEDDAGVAAGAREPGVLGEEAVAGMDGLGAGLLRGVEDAVDAQVALARWRGADRHRFVGVQHVQRGAVGLGVDGDRRIAELAAGADDADRDLAAIGNEDLHGGAL